MSFNPMSLEGKRILVTGASSGIGRTSAKVFAALGAEVILLARDQDRLSSTQAELENSEKHIHYSFDLSSADEIPDFIKDIAKQRGRLDGLFHAAGTISIKPLKMVKTQDIHDIFVAAFNAGMMLVKGFSQKTVRSQGPGSVVWMSSVTSISGQAGMSVYSASKGAVDAAVRSLACELAKQKIRINSIISAAIQTEMLERVTPLMPADSFKAYQEKHLLGFGKPEDIANMAAYLLSDAGGWITGSSIVVDGGYSCQ